jgi:hypothetical protein
MSITFIFDSTIEHEIYRNLFAQIMLRVFSWQFKVVGLQKIKSEILTYFETGKIAK